MMSQQQNLSSVSQSLLQQTISGADVKPFSIRQCVLASRHTNILQSWPFHEKHLQLCLNQGLKEVLPPFGRQTSPAESLQGCSNFLMHFRNVNDDKEPDFCKAEEVPQNIKNEYCDYKVTNQPSSHEEGNQQHKCGISSSSNVHKSNPVVLLPPSKAVKDKRRRRRGRCKKRSIVDILAEARHSTLEEIHRMNKFYYDATVIEGCQQTVAYENISKSELAGEDGSEDRGMPNNVHMAPNGPFLLKFKLNGCSVNRNFRT
ncbi:uncharacterized protein LOC114370996 [Glycine soja]|uniref:Uncharacterized protein n=1 Tax=Glycine soja TaxID=3848 RepID=A0A445IUF3_GLYSO|nr:uncharacterized protein LOC114370996 [Glycine soja]KHN37302.1 hypothetical protein glysoja_013517 [Glycine soja]RZB89725.1 hypothetical protein D0Y65_028479 [Glycine soja]